MNNNSAKGSNWSDYRKTILTNEELAEVDVKVALISEMIKARRDKGYTQTQIEEMSGVRQPIIARMEKGETDPRLNTVIKVLNSMGKTLKIVDM